MIGATRLLSHLATRRRAAGLTVTELAARTGVSRQALTAIEAGRSAPSTAVSLRLAGALGCRVEDLFSLEDPPVPAEVVGRGARVVVARVAGRWVAHALDPLSAAPADGVTTPDGVRLLEEADALERKVLIAGCAPVLGPLAGHVDHTRDVRASWIHAASGAALAWLAAGQVHVAGMHLAHRTAPGDHDRLVRQALPGVQVEIVSLVGWRQGLAVAPGNPLGLRGPADLGRPGLRIARRPAGSGAAQVLERARIAAGLPDLAGPVVTSHLDAVQAVAAGTVDAAVVIEPLTEAYGLGFLPLSEERFELAFRSDQLDHPGVARLLDRLAESRFAREVAAMGAYDTGCLGDARRLEAA